MEMSFLLDAFIGQIWGNLFIWQTKKQGKIISELSL